VEREPAIKILNCRSCGAENSAAAQACASCGEPLAAATPARHVDTRRIVSVLFADIEDSTVLGEELDAESLRGVLARYFDEMESILEQHGAIVEKFIGDAILAVFGVPDAHEDDALRAVRAAVEMRERLGILNEHFAQEPGVRVAIRIGVNTGEVVAGDVDRRYSFVTGDVVNIAARLEESAQSGDILIGDLTYRLVSDAVLSEPMEPLQLKGKSSPVKARRLLGIVPGTPGRMRRLDSPIVGRERELALLEDSFAHTVAHGSCSLVTLMAPAGVGKSRLIEEFISRVKSRAVVIRGRCLPYGEGITFSPVVSVLTEAAGITSTDSPAEARRKIGELLPTSEGPVADRLAALLGAAGPTPGIQETFWAVRRLIEHVGTQRPLVVVVDDIHWAEPTLLDLLEYLGDWIRHASVLLVCLARRELLDVRPGWTMVKANASLIPLRPLNQTETDDLIRNLVGGAELEPGARAAVAAVAEGNPLFVEETLRMLVDDGILVDVDGRWTTTRDVGRISIPPTIQSLLTARLDRLSVEERAVIDCAAVVGRVFGWGAVAELSQQEISTHVTVRLQSLMRKELIQPDESGRREREDTFRFTHVLIRDAAYRGIPKSVRADLHRRLADWMESQPGNRSPEYDEVRGYHLEQAHASLVDLGVVTPATEAVGRRAAAALASAGRRAFARGDMPAAVTLLTRAAALLPQREPERVDLSLQLGFALLETGEFARLQVLLAEMNEAAGDESLKAQTLILGLWVRLWTDPEGWAEESEREARRAIAAFQEAGDDRGLAKGWALLGLVHGMRAEFHAAEEAWSEAAEHARVAEDRRDELESLSWVPLLTWAGPTNCDDGMERCRRVRERAEGDKKATSSVLMAEAAFEAGLGRFDEARQLIAQAKGLLEEVALTVWMAGPLVQFEAWIELLAGDAAAAERSLRWGYETLDRMGELSWLSTVVAMLADAVYEQGRHEEAAELTAISEASAGADDAYSQALLRSVRAKVLARRGEDAEAERLAREALALTDRTDFLHLCWHVRMSTVEVLLLTGRREEAAQRAEEAIRLAELKGNVVAADRALTQLATATAT
jgi:class 3 adenylate cyclase/tetratricopeptide (TPR) repeat protein